MLNLDNISIAFGHVTLLDGVNLRIEKGERVCLIGRNGEGKSTLLKIISNQIQPDNGKLEKRSNCKITLLNQEHNFNPDDTVFHAVSKGMGKLGELIEKYHDLVQRVAKNETKLLPQLEQVQHRLEAEDGWRLEQKVETILSKLNLPTDQPLSELSGGWRRRVALAQILVTEPNLLLLDEPTNHLDIEAITWLEEMLLDFNGSLLFVSHDRQFMQRIATRIIELDRGKITSYPSNYNIYLRTKEANLEAEMTQAAKFDKNLAKEEVWIRQGIKARRTRNQGRVRNLQKLRTERAQRRNQIGNIKLNIDSGELSGRIVIEAENIGKNYQDKVLVKNFSTIVMRGDRVGLIGANGTGKTTLLKMLLNELEPDDGAVKHGTKLSIAYFDQLRTQLNPESTVVDAVSQGQDMLTINGQKKHVMSYLADFLFAPARARSPVKSLSGGERNRLLLARLFTKPANLLVLDEPTNDLDVESLELLEELLNNYSGTLLLVSHDRKFLDNVVTSTIVFEGQGKVTEYVGGYADWLRQRPQITKSTTVSKKTTPKQIETKSTKSRKITYNEQRELAELPNQIEALEIELSELQTLVSSSEFYQQETQQVNQTLNRIKAIETNLQKMYKRWEELENI
ncbi:ATP-binding cassette domain-containing protein [Candidatus Halobeggiatoa sp. HSG11]|nr:ATP-binding cassette domain-containing protein [Candidatus Halobeggiatoa sp. HSG11]